MNGFQAFLKRKNIVISARRYGIDALGAMAQGLFASLLIGTILNTLGTQFHIGFLTTQVITINQVGYTIGGLCSFMSGPAMAVAIGYALQAPPLVLFSLVTAGYACNALGGAGGPLAVLFVAIIAAECGKAVSKETKVDILVTPIVTILVGIGVAWLIAPLVSQGLGTSMLQMGNIVKNPRIWIPPILTSAVTGPLATCLFRLEMNGAPINSGMGTCGLCGQLGVWTGWVAPSEQALSNGAMAITPGAFEWLGLILISFVLPALLTWAFGLFFRKIDWIKEGDLKLD